MKGFAKGFTLCLLLLGLLATTVSAASVENCPGGCTHQAAIGTTHYDTLQEAFAAAIDGTTVTLLTDISGQTALSTDKSISLDLGGKTLSGSNGANEPLLNVSGNFTLRNGTATTGLGGCLLARSCNLVIEKSATLRATGDAVALVFESGAPVIMNLQNSGTTCSAVIAGKISSQSELPAITVSAGGTATAHVTFEKTASVTATEGSALQFVGNGSLTVKGGTFRAQEHAFVLSVPEKGELKASVTGGKFTTEKDPFSITAGKDATVPGKFVTGGTFSRNPSTYTPAYCVIQTNSDSTYTVISAYTLTFQANGGSGTMSAVSVRCGSSCTLPACGFTAPSGQEFKGWEIGGVTYAPGSSYTPTGDTTVKALWGEHIHTGGKATCQKKAVCSVCGESYGMKGSHDLRSVGAYAPTCTADGRNAHKRCATCGKRFVNGEQVSLSDLSMPALGHFWQKTEGSPADCQHDGVRAHERCVNCGLLQADGQSVTEEALVIPSGGHALEAVEKIEATCTQAGTLAHQHCTVCDLLLVEGQPVEADQLITATSSHVLSDWYSDGSGHWKTCVDCGEEFRRSSHKAGTDGTCIDCGSDMADAEEAAANQQEASFSRLFLIPIIAAVGIAGALAVVLFLKSRK